MKLTHEEALRRIAGYARRLALDLSLYENKAFADIERTACLALQYSADSTLEEKYGPSIIGSSYALPVQEPVDIDAPYKVVEDTISTLDPVEKEFVKNVKECDGMEIHRDEWAEVDKLVEKGILKWVSGARGPNKDFKRVGLA
jgi:hypothetical protein